MRNIGCHMSHAADLVYGSKKIEMLPSLARVRLLSIIEVGLYNSHNICNFQILLMPEFDV